MASIIVLCDGDVTLHVSDLDKEEAAEKIAGYFEDFSTDHETTSINRTEDAVVVEMNCRGEEHDIARIFDFTPQNLRLALKEIGSEESENLEQAGVIDGQSASATVGSRLKRERK